MMNQKMNATLARGVLTLLVALPVLAACHTAEGAGQDISDTGRVISHDAARATP